MDSELRTMNNLSGISSPAARPRPVICESPGSKLKHGSAVRLKRG